MLDYEEAKRQRQRLHVRRSYHRKLNKIHAIRDMVRQLTEQHHAAIARQEQILKDKLQDPAQLEASRTRALQLYVEASKLSDQLRRENEELQLLVDEREKLEMKLSNVANDFGVGKDDKDGFVAMSAALAQDAPVKIVPVTLEECQVITTKTYANVCHFLSSSSYLTTGAGVFGWRDRCKLDDGHLTFSMKKNIAGFTPGQLCQRSWTVYSNAQALEKMYPAVWNVNIQRMQQVDDNNVIMFRIYSINVSVESLFLVSRFKIERGFALLLRSVDQAHLVDDGSKFTEDGRPKQWLDVHTWLLFEKDKKDTVVNFGGMIPFKTLIGSTALLIEVLLIAVRWENQVVGPIVSLEAS